MILRPAPSGMDSVAWYEQALAGVPLLVRNLLTLKRSGFDRISLLGIGKANEFDALIDRLAREDRLAGAVERFTGWGGKQQENAHFEPVLVLEGNCVYLRGSFDDFPLRRTGASSDSLHFRFNEEGRKLETVSTFAEIITPHGSLDNWLPDPVDSGTSIVYFAASQDTSADGDGGLERHKRRVLKEGTSSHDSFVTRVLSRPVSMLMTRWLLPTSLTPNAVTVVSILIGLLAVTLIYRGTYLSGLAGSILLILSTWIDGVDGEIARIKFLESSFGAKLDIYGDNIVHTLLFLAMGAGISQAQGEVRYLVLGVVASIGALTAFLMLQTSLRKKKQSASHPKGNGGRASGLENQLAHRDFLFLVLILALINRLDLFLWIAAFGVNAFNLLILSLRVIKR